MSIYCLELLQQLPKHAQEEILYSNSKEFVAIEAGTGLCLANLTKGGKVVNISEFGKSGKGGDLADYFGFTVEKVLERIN